VNKREEDVQEIKKKKREENEAMSVVLVKLLY
jgi:hypothetical protein